MEHVRVLVANRPRLLREMVLSTDTPGFRLNRAGRWRRAAHRVRGAAASLSGTPHHRRGGTQDHGIFVLGEDGHSVDCNRGNWKRPPERPAGERRLS